MIEFKPGQLVKLVNYSEYRQWHPYAGYKARIVGKNEFLYPAKCAHGVWSVKVIMRDREIDGVYYGAELEASDSATIG